MPPAGEAFSFFAPCGTKHSHGRSFAAISAKGETHMNGIIYLVGLIVIIMFILSFLGLR